MEIRPVQPDEYEKLGRLTVRSYRHLSGGEPLGDYEQVLADVQARVLDCEVFVAVDDLDTVMGGITYVPGPHTSMSEFEDPDAAGIRHLAVDPRFQGSGVGRALLKVCIDHARELKRPRLRLHSTTPMVIARAMYERMGFTRAPEFDIFFTDPPYSKEEPFHLISYVMELSQS
jgi:ribosomal protein S18 acetylase RimI-like enzyme